MKTNEPKIDDNKVDKFFNQQLEIFINNANKDGLNLYEVCCASARLFIVIRASEELFYEGITNPTKEQTDNKRNEILMRLCKFYNDAVK